MIVKKEFIRKTVVWESIRTKTHVIRILRFGRADKKSRIVFALTTGKSWAFGATVRNVVGVSLAPIGPSLKIRTGRDQMSRFSISRQTEYTT